MSVLSQKILICLYHISDRDQWNLMMPFFNISTRMRKFEIKILEWLEGRAWKIFFFMSVPFLYTYFESAKKAIATFMKVPGLIEFRANRNVLGSPQAAVRPCGGPSVTGRSLERLRNEGLLKLPCARSWPIFTLRSGGRRRWFLNPYVLPNRRLVWRSLPKQSRRSAASSRF